MNWMKKHKINVLHWPAVSPDLNVIENIWDIIDKKLTKCHPTSVNDLQLMILKLWTETSAQACTDLVQSMTRRIKKCIQVRGSHRWNRSTFLRTGAGTGLNKSDRTGPAGLPV